MNKYEEALNNLLGQDSGYYANDENVKIIHEAIRKANKYDEKEKPEKVELEADGYANGELVYDTAVCPDCNRHFEIDYDEHFKYCPDCGRKLDWGDVDE